MDIGAHTVLKLYLIPPQPPDISRLPGRMYLSTDGIRGLSVGRLPFIPAALGTTAVPNRW